MILLVVGMSSTYAQNRIEIGANGRYYTTWLINSNWNAEGRPLDPQMTFQPQTGIHAGFRFDRGGGTAALKAEFDVINIKQSFSGEIKDGSGNDQSYDAFLKARNMNFGIILDYRSYSGFYFEGGLHFVSSTEWSSEYTVATGADLNHATARSISVGGGQETYEVDNLNTFFRSGGALGVIGFGGVIPISESVYINLGLRAYYGFSSVRKDKGIARSVTIDNNEKESMPTFLWDKFNSRTSPAYGGVHLGIVVDLWKEY